MDPLLFLSHGSLALRRVRARFPLRSWSSFFDTKAFRLPQFTPKSIVSRAETNVQFFLANYFALGAAVVLLNAFYYPLSLVTLLVVICFWTWLAFFRLTSTVGEDVDFFGAFSVPAIPFYAGSVVATVIAVAVSSGLSLSLWMILCLLHSVLRRRSVKSATSVFFAKVRGRDLSSAVDTALMGGISSAAREGETIAIDLSQSGRPSTSEVTAQHRAVSDSIRQKYAAELE
jgi:PRA1 family protein